MKRTIPLVLLAAAALVLIGLVLAQRDPASRFTDDHEAWEAYVEGDRLLQSFRWAEAEDRLAVAIERDPQFTLAHAAFAELHARMGLRTMAAEHFATADSLAALDDDPYSRLLVQVRLSNHGQSRFYEDRDSLLTRAKEIVGDHVLVLASEAVRAAEAGEVERAETVWNRVLEINPNYAAAYNYLGYLYLAQGRYDEAEAAMRRYAFVAPDLANPHDSLGEVLMTVGRYEEAEVEFRTALAKQPDFFHSLMNIGRIYMLRGQVDKANELLDRVHQEVAGTEWEHEVEIRRLRALFMHRITDELDTYAARYIEANPEASYTAYVRIWRRLALGDQAGTLALLDSLNAEHQASEWYQNNPAKRARAEVDQLRYRGLVAEMAGDHASAAQAFRQTITEQSDLPPHSTSFERIHLAYNLVSIDELQEAREQVRTVLEVNPRLPEAVLVGALIEAAAGDVASAHRYLDTLERMLERADADFPTLVDARQVRAQLPDPGRI
ncbi:tetratricopeptide repeat protein [bacterium]|nr:tetratricopeptide repeat protein [bacterium]